MNILFFKMAFRHLLKNKLYSFINIAGLAIGVASFVLIMLYVRYEQSYDVFKGSENVYRVYMDYTAEGAYVPGDAQAYILSGQTIRDNFPEVKEQLRLLQIAKSTVVQEDQAYADINGSLTDPNYLEMMDTHLAKGDEKKALEEPYSIVISQKLAKKLYGNDDPLGKTLSVFWRTKALFTVTGVLEETNRKSHINNDFLISFSSFASWDAFKNQWNSTWNQNSYFTYIKVAPGTDIANLREKIMALPVGDFEGERHNIEPIESIHLYSDKPYEADINGSADNIRLLFAIALVVILLSWLNYVNLTTTKSMERARETGIKKVVGAKAPQLVVQSLMESLILTFFGVFLAAVLLGIFFPYFNTLSGISLNWDMETFKQLFPVLGFVVLGSIVFALYPAIAISKFGIIFSLKGKFRPKSNGFPIRKVLVVGQFLATMVLLFGTFAITKQIQFMQNQSIGADLDQVVALNGTVLEEMADSLRFQRFQTLEKEIGHLSNVKGVAMADTYPGGGYNNLSSSVGITFPDGTEDGKRIWYNYGADTNYFDLMGIQFVAGGPFVPNAQDRGDQIVINTQFARFIGLSNVADAVGKTVNFWDRDWTIKGVVDYHHFGLKSAVEPLLIRYVGTNDQLLVKLDGTDLSSNGTKASLAQLQTVWKNLFPDSTFDYRFVDQEFAAQYDRDRKFADSFGVFSVLAMIIAGLGLFGLTTYVSFQRTKEIGIRKVNGATIGQVLYLLNQDILKWVGLAFVLSVPLAWYLMHKWLQNFALKTSLSWWLFALTGGLVLLVALFTVSWQSWHAATTNPVNILRDE
ncbi:protein of unknown function DUF214 [Allomuricauda ruestringensis DSM 13258]|uniref:ABC3 transporter permease protein domain-containing protein n=1 Tax=Allomuricauda ruestringensis (strain DSM 13258 / CIP 107369 / LMG 19739 / B1) TaxID=886377 RepID=G2PNY1_ALLRU|nr:ABC transporter permease [Allomuricauda ruestringensis]AEM70316.1 protein of unknown function DUF214 [Allomuricauda ruestringensis DSM 13258]